MLRILIFVAVAMVAFVALAQLLRRTGMFFPDSHGDWNHPGVENVTFTTSDGVKLHGWYFRATDANAPLLVWFHGNGGNLTYRVEPAEKLARRGISVFLFDWRGYGKSEGRPTERTLFHDALAAYDFAVTRAKPENIVLYGESLGGPYAAWVAKKKKARCVILENSFPSLKDLGNALYAPLPLGWTAPRALRTTDWLNDAGIPVLVMHGRRDSIIPYRLGEQIFNELRVPKEMLTADTADHAAIPYVEPRYYEAVVRFVNR
ncbi:MAG TPA: alpha/beta hydrolase [Thermoanaerobaculia bacterium]